MRSTAGQRKERRERKKDEREKPLLFNRHKVVCPRADPEPRKRREGKVLRVLLSGRWLPRPSILSQLMIEDLSG